MILNYVITSKLKYFKYMFPFLQLDSLVTFPLVIYLYRITVMESKFHGYVMYFYTVTISPIYILKRFIKFSAEFNSIYQRENQSTCTRNMSKYRYVGCKKLN